MKNVAIAIDRFCLTIRIAPWWLHALLLGVILGTIILEYLVLQTEFFLINRYQPELWRNPQFILVCVVQFVRIVVVLFIVGRLNTLDIGLESRLVIPAVITFLTVWVAHQAFRASLGLILVGQPIMKDGVSPLLGNPIAAMTVVGSACEELLVRGFFMLQLYVIARSRLNYSTFEAAAISIGVVATGFALFHVPRLVMDGGSLTAITRFLSITIMVGLSLGIVFARSGNVLVAMGLHCFQNVPVNVIAIPSGLSEYVVWTVELVIMIIVVHATAAVLARFRSDGGS